MALVFDLPPRNHFEAFEQRLGLAPAVRLDDADDDIDPSRRFAWAVSSIS